MMDDVIITSFNQIIWNHNNVIKIYDITEIRKIDDSIRFDIKGKKLKVSFEFSSDTKHEIGFVFDIETKKVEKTFFGIKYFSVEKLKINKDKNIYELIQEVSQFYRLTKNQKNKLIEFQRKLEEINQKRREV